MVTAVLQTIPYLVLFSHIAIILSVLVFLGKYTWGRNAASFIGRHAIPLSFIVVLGAVLGSLFYSNVVGYEPCVLCWWQRVFLYPLVLIFGVALWRKFENSYSYAMPLIVLAGVVSLYQSYANLGGSSFLPCTSEGGACSKVYVKAFGYITIPTMSLTVVAMLVMLWLFNRNYRINENSNAR